MRVELALALVTLVLPAPAWGGEPSSPAGDEELRQALAFAESLFAEADYYRAITEYKRALSLAPEAPLASRIRLRIGRSYLEGGRSGAALPYFESLFDDPSLGPDARLQAARAWLRERRFAPARELLADLLDEPDPRLLGEARYLAGCLSLRQGLGAAAREHFLSLPAGHALAERALWLADEALRIPAIPKKSPALAGVLSLVPGLGHLYLGEAGTGLLALSVNGLFGFAAADTFRGGHIGAGTLLAAIALFLYSGTIYGAVESAHRFNRDAEQNFLDELEREAGLDVPAGPGGFAPSWEGH